MSDRVILNIILIILVAFICCFDPEVLLPQNFSVIDNLNDTDLIRIEFRYKNGKPIPILKLYKDRVIVQADGKGQKIILSERSKLFFDGGEYFGLYQRVDFKGTDPAKTEFSVYSIEGEKIWSVSGELIWDQFEPHWIIDPMNGAALKIESSFGAVTYFDSEGNPTQIKNFNVTEHDYERSFIGAFSPKGRYFAIAGQTQEDITSNSSTLILFDEHLSVVFEKSLDQYKITQLKFSQEGKRIVFSGYKLSDNGTIESKITHLIDKRGDMLSSYPVLSEQISFSEDGRYIAISDGKIVYRADLNRGKIVWQKKLGGNGRIITNIDISPDGDHVAILSGTTRYQNLRYNYENLELVLFNSEGELLREEKLRDRSVIKPTLQISPDGGSIAVGFKNGWSLLQRPDK